MPTPWAAMRSTMGRCQECAIAQRVLSCMRSGAPAAASQGLEVYYGVAEDRGGRKYMQVRCSLAYQGLLGIA